MGRALGEFLRKHRELAGKPPVNKQAGERKRRTSGLRREEVAQMAGISLTWYTRLEQGKMITASGAVLGRIASVLRLVPAERAYLFQLAGRIDPTDTSNFADGLVKKDIESCVLSISYPAFVLDKYWTLLFWNAELADLFPQWLNGPEKNLLRYMFLDLSARSFVGDWELRARHLLALFRDDFGRHLDDPKMLDMVRRLSEESDLFQKAWGEQQVRFWDRIERSYNHPQRGLLRFVQTTFLAAAEPTLKLIIMKPCS